MQYHPDKNPQGKAEVYKTIIILLLLLTVIIVADANQLLTFYTKKKVY